MKIWSWWLIKNAEDKSRVFPYVQHKAYRKYPTSEATQSLVHAIVLWVAPDYRNNLIFNTPATHIAKHQRVQNYAARLA